MDFWIHNGFLDLQWIPGFTMDSCIHDRFLDLRWISGFTIDSWIHDGFLDSRWIFGSPTRLTTLLQALFFCEKWHPYVGSPTRLTTLPQALHPPPRENVPNMFAIVALGLSA